MYGPTDLGLREADKRPYGDTTVEDIEKRERQSAARSRVPTPGPAPQAGGPPGRNPGTPPDPSGYETPVLGGLQRGLDFIDRGISGAVGALPGDDSPLPGAGGPSEKTTADEWLPALARQVLDNFVMQVAPGLRIGLQAGGMKPEQVSLQERHAAARATELRGQYEGISENDAATIARLENAYNALGGSLLAGTAALLGFTGAGVVVGATVTAAVVAGGALADEEQVERGERRLPKGSIGREVASLAVPEAAILQPLRLAVNAVRLRTAAHLVVGGADDALDAAKASVSDLQTVARVADEQAARAPDAAASKAAAEVRDEAQREADAIRRTVGITPPTPVESAAEDVQAFLRQVEPEAPTVGDELVRAYEKAEGRIARVLSRMTDTTTSAATTGAKVKVSRTGRTLVNEVEQVIEDLQTVSTRYGAPLPQEHYDALLRLRDEVRAEEMAIAARNIAIREGKKAGREELRDAKTAHGKAETAAVNTKRDIERAETRGLVTERAQAQVYEREELAALRQRARQITDAAEDVEEAGEGVAKAEQKGEDAARSATRSIEREGISIVTRADREKERLAAAATRNEGRLASVRERTQRFLQGRRPKATVEGIDIDAVRTGYVRPDDSEVLARTNIHTGKHDSEVFGRWMRELIEQNPDKVARAAGMNTDDLMELVRDLAQRTGVDPARFAATLPKRGQVAARLYLGDVILGAKTREWAEMGQAVARGDGSAEELAKLTEDLTAFTNSLTEGVSEIGRALWSRKLIVKDRTAALVRSDAEVHRTEATLRRTATRLSEADEAAAAVRKEVDAAQKGVEDRAAAEVAALEERRVLVAADAAAKADADRAAATAKMDEVEARLAALTGDRVAFTESSRARIAAAEKRVDDAIKAHEDALAAHEEAMARASDAYSEMRAAIVRNSAKMHLTPDDMVILAKMDPSNTIGLINWLRDARKPRPLAWVQSYLANSLYGSVVSLQQNMLNTFSSVMLDELLEPVARVGARALTNRIVGETVFAPGNVEQKARMLGAWDAIPDAFRAAFRTQLEGDDVIRELRWGVKVAGQESVEPISGLARSSAVPGKRGLLVEGALRNLRSADLFNRIWTTGAESRALLAREQWLRGEQGVGEALAGLKNGQEQYVRVAARSSAARTFNDELASDSLRRSFLNTIGKDWKGLRIGLVLIPAARFGFSWARAGLDAMPVVGAARGLARANAARSLEGVERVVEGREASRTMARSVAGSAVTIAGVWAYQNDVLTGAYPTDPVERERWRSQGKQAVSFRVGEMWVPLALLPPVVGAPLTLVALFGDQLKHEPDPNVAIWEDRTERAAAVLGQWVSDIPGLRGLGDVLDVMLTSAQRGGNAAWDRWAAAKVSLAMPYSSTGRSVVPAFDPLMRAPEGIGQNIQQRVPGLSGELPAARGGLGEAIARPVSGPAALAVTQATTLRPLDDVYVLMDELGIRYTGTGSQIGDTKLNREEAERYQEIAGPLVKWGMDYLRTTKEFAQQRDPLVRQKLAEKAISAATKEGRRRFTAEIVQQALVGGDEKTIVRAVVMYRSQAEEDEMRKLLRYMLSSGRLTETIAKRLDETRPATTTGRAPTVADYFKGGR